VDELWEKFNAACEWRRVSISHNCSFYGPGIMKTTCDEYARTRLRDVLKPLGLVPLEPVYVGLLWADLDGQGYWLYKIREGTEELPGFERPHTVAYSLVPVDPDKTRAAFAWAQEELWRPRGIWLGQPALLFCFDIMGVMEALPQIPQVRQCLAGGKLYFAPARYDWRGQDNTPYPYIKPTRARDRVQGLRSRYPTAGDVLWTPTEILLRQKHGDKMDAAPALAV